MSVAVAHRLVHGGRVGFPIWVNWWVITGVTTPMAVIWCLLLVTLTPCHDHSSGNIIGIRVHSLHHWFPRWCYIRTWVSSYIYLACTKSTTAPPHSLLLLLFGFHPRAPAHKGDLRSRPLEPRHALQTWRSGFGERSFIAQLLPVLGVIHSLHSDYDYFPTFWYQANDND
jgi:hypothetical protein